MISTSITDKGKYITKSTSLSPFDEVYNAVQTTNDPTINDHLLVASDQYHLPYWLDSTPIFLDYLSHTFPSDESIMEVISLEEIPCE